METATVVEVENDLRAYLMKVSAGETIVITDGECPVARLEPWSIDVLAEPPPAAGASVLAALLEERRKGR